MGTGQKARARHCFGYNINRVNKGMKGSKSQNVIPTLFLHCKRLVMIRKGKNNYLAGVFISSESH